MIAASEKMRKVIYETLCACLGLSPGTAAAAALVYPAYAEPGPAPQPPRERNVICFSLLRDEGAGDWPQTAVSAQIRSFLAYRLLIVCYGPDAEKHAHRIRAMLYTDGAGQPRSILRKAGIYPIPRPEQPLLLAEPEDSRFRLRADLEISLRVTDVLETRVAGIASVPKIIVHG